MNKGLWPITAMAVALMGAIVTIVLTAPPSDVAARDIALSLLMALGPLLGGVWATRHTDAKVNEVRDQVTEVNEKVNGRMSQLIEKKTLPDEAPPPA